jgi:O-antigen ligase
MFISATQHHSKPEAASGINVFMAAIWFLYLVLKPVYLMPHGLPQLSDGVLAAGLIPAMIFMFMNARPGISQATLTGGLFVALTVAINLVNYIFIPDKKFILAALYYPYNFMIFLFVVFLFRQNAERMARLTVWGILIGLTIQVVFSHFFPNFGQGSGRITGSFSNPNQLAYWALLSAVMLVFLRRDGKFGWMDFTAICLAGFLQTLALSKAGIITYGLFLCLLVFIPQVPRLTKMVLLFLLMAGISYFSFSAGAISLKSFERVAARLQTIGVEADDSLEGRGYDRIAENPGYIIVGSGEGGFERFQGWGSPAELHSGLATILFSYGILGLMFFGGFLYFIFYRQPWYCIAALFIVLLFSVTSQTIRFTHTWVFLGVACGSFLVRREEEGAGRGAIPEAQALQRQSA